MSLIAAFRGSRSPCSVRNTALCSPPPRYWRRWNSSLTIWPSHCFQASVILLPRLLPRLSAPISQRYCTLAPAQGLTLEFCRCFLEGLRNTRNSESEGNTEAQVYKRNDREHEGGAGQLKAGPYIQSGYRPTRTNAPHRRGRSSP